MRRLRSCLRGSSVATSWSAVSVRSVTIGVDGRKDEDQGECAVVVSMHVKRLVKHLDEQRALSNSTILSVASGGVNSPSFSSAPVFATMPNIPPSEVARRIVALPREARTFHNLLWTSADFELASGCSPVPQTPRWHFVADIDVSNDRCAEITGVSVSNATAADRRRVYGTVLLRIASAIDACLGFWNGGKLRDHRVLLLDGQRADKLSAHVYVFFDHDSRLSFPSPQEVKGFAAEVNKCLGLHALDMLIYRPFGTLRLPFSDKTQLHPDGSTASRRLIPWVAGDSAALAQLLEWSTDMSEADLIALVLQTRFYFDYFAASSLAEPLDVSFKARPTFKQIYDENSDSMLQADTDTRSTLQILREAEAIIDAMPDAAAEPYAEWSRVLYLLRRIAARDSDPANDRLAHRIADAFSRRCPPKYNTRMVAKTYFSRSIKQPVPPATASLNALRKMLRSFDTSANVYPTSQSPTSLTSSEARCASATVPANAASQTVEELEEPSFESASKAAEQWKL
jgi:hypothetical protein